MRQHVMVFALCGMLLLFTGVSAAPVLAGQDTSELEQSMSETLDLWREGRFEQVFERLAHRGSTSREQFVAKMRGAEIRPACCWQKLEQFKVLNEKRTEATVFAKVGLEGSPHAQHASTREFKLTHEEGIWKMQLKDVMMLSGATTKKGKHGTHKKYSKKITTP